jgi:hypothetical protein
MGWPCDLSIDDYCNDPRCRGGRECQAWLCTPEDFQGNQEKDLGTPRDDTSHGHGGRRQSVTERQK